MPANTNTTKRSRGFTLIELMIVVVIITVLSALAIGTYRRFTYAARNSEAQQFLLSIRAAQASYFQAFGQYCGTADGDLWPQNMPFTYKLLWEEPEGTWAVLGIKSPGAVWFQYKLMAGRDGGDAPGESFLERPTGPWYVVRAHGDFDNNQVLSTFEVTSAKPDVYVNNESE